MARIYKSFQLKIDKKHPFKVTTGQLTRTDEREIMEEQIMEDVFRELPIDKFIREKTEKPVREDEEAEELDSVGEDLEPKVGDQDEFESVDESIEDLSKSPSVRKIKGKIAMLLNAANRRAGELQDKEESLREWEKALLDREKYLNNEEAKIRREIAEKRAKVEQEANQILEVSKRSADTILKTAQSEEETSRKAFVLELEEIKAKAQKEGFALGEQKGIADGEKAGLGEARIEWLGLMQETEMLITELQTSRMGILKASEEEMVRLVLGFARQVIKVECKTNPEILLKNIDAALNKISEVDKIVMRINLRDKSMAEAKKEEFLRRLSGVSELRIVEDPGLSPGGVKIETGVGTVDASIETQIEELEKNLVKILNRQE